MAITFRELKPYISRRIPISIAFRDGSYDDYNLISDIPTGKYDDMYVYGVGTIDVEFPLDVYKRPAVTFANMEDNDKTSFECGLEIVLQGKPREIQRQNEEMLLFCDLRGYLQKGMNFSVVRWEDWSAEYYTYRNDIPEYYNDLYVYGIGMDDVSRENLPDILKKVDYEMLVGSREAKEMTIVLAKNPREDLLKSYTMGTWKSY